MIVDKKQCQKINFFSNMSNSMIFGGHFENMNIRSLRRHFSACQHYFLDLAYQINHTLIKMSNPFFHKMPVIVNSSDLFS